MYTASSQTVKLLLAPLGELQMGDKMVGEGAEPIELLGVSFMQVAGHLVEVSAATTDANRAKMGTHLW